MFLKLTTVVCVLIQLGPVNSREIPGHRSLAFATAGQVLAPMKGFCSANQVCLEEPVRVGAWNLQRFGVAKMGKPAVIDVIVKVIHNYDLMILQEVTDSSGTAIPHLLQETNKNLPAEEQYQTLLSPRIGRTSYKEQYVYFYKPSRMAIQKSYLYNDTTDAFQFEPFVVHFNTTSMGPLKDFVVIPLHAKPSDAEKETDALTDVYDDMVSRWNISDAFLLGDFNAGCSYITQSEFDNIRLYTQSRFHWIISDHADTTTKTTSCPYDRIVVAGEKLQAATYYKTATIYFFDEHLGIEKNWTLVEDVSDHYPVGVMIRGTVPSKISQSYGSEVSPLATKVTVDVELLPDCWAAVYALTQGLPGAYCNETTSASFVQPRLVMTQWLKFNLNDAVELVIKLANDHPRVVTKEAVAIIGYKAGHEVLTDHTLYAPKKTIGKINVVLLCRESYSNPLCTLSLTVPTYIN